VPREERMQRHRAAGPRLQQAVYFHACTAIHGAHVCMKSNCGQALGLISCGRVANGSPALRESELSRLAPLSLRVRESAVQDGLA
jgi:hypothetical protein